MVRAPRVHPETELREAEEGLPPTQFSLSLHEEILERTSARDESIGEFHYQPRPA